MRCPICEKQELSSKYYFSHNTIGATLLSSIDYYDEKGRFHYHDPNIHTVRSECSNGHKFIHRRMRNCCEEVPGMEESIDLTND